MFSGFRSLWMIPLLWRYCTCTHTHTQSRFAVTKTTEHQSHLNSSQHLIEVKFSDGLTQLLPRLDSVEQLPPLHPTGRQTGRQTHRGLISRSHDLTVLHIVLPEENLQLTTPARCNSCHLSDKNPGFL